MVERCVGWCVSWGVWVSEGLEVGHGAEVLQCIIVGAIVWGGRGLEVSPHEN